MEIHYDWKKADVLFKEAIFDWDNNGTKGCGDFFRACLKKYAELHPDTPRPNDLNIIYALLMELGFDGFIQIGMQEGEKVDWNEKTGIPSTSIFNIREIERAYLLELAYLFSFEENRFDETETIRGIWYLKQGFKQFSILSLKGIKKFDGRRASQDLSNVLSEMVHSGSFEYLASFGIADESAWSDIADEKGFLNFVVCVEKDARAPKLIRACKCLGLKVIVSGGGRPSYAKAEDLWYSYLRENCNEENPLYILIIVDFDPAGFGIIKDFVKHFKRYTDHLKAIHVGIFPWQLPENELDPFESLYDLNAGKRTIYRFVKENGNEFLEVMDTKATKKEKKGWKRKDQKDYSKRDKWINEYAFRIQSDDDPNIYDPYSIEIDVISSQRWNELIFQAIIQNTPYSSQQLIDYDLRNTSSGKINCSNRVDEIIDKVRNGEYNDPFDFEGNGEKLWLYFEAENRIEELQEEIGYLEEFMGNIHGELVDRVRPICNWVNAEIPIVDGRIAPNETPIWQALKTKETSFRIKYLNDKRFSNAKKAFFYHYEVYFEELAYNFRDRPHYRPKYNSSKFSEFHELFEKKIEEMIDSVKEGKTLDIVEAIDEIKDWFKETLSWEILDWNKPHIDQVILKFAEKWLEFTEELKRKKASEIAEQMANDEKSYERAYQSILDWFTGNNRDPLSKEEIKALLKEHFGNEK